jgi:hypothetical protein
VNKVNQSFLSPATTSTILQMEFKWQQLIDDIPGLLSGKHTTVPPIINSLHKFEVRRAYVITQAGKLLQTRMDNILEELRPRLEEIADPQRSLIARKRFFILALGWRRRVRCRRLFAMALLTPVMIVDGSGS